MFKLKCYISISPDSYPNIKAYIVDFVQIHPNSLYEDGPIPAGSNKPLYVANHHAIVILEEFDKGAIWQLPFTRIRVVEYWEDEIA